MTQAYFIGTGTIVPVPVKQSQNISKWINQDWDEIQIYEYECE